MEVIWQSNVPKMNLVVPTGAYVPYELPIASKEVLGGVKIDGDSITITDDGVISAKEVDLSGVATKEELAAVEDSIPSINGLATKIELATVESKIPNTDNFATKVELSSVAATIPSVSNFATKAELNNVKSSIPDTTGFATKIEIQAIENKIPDVSNFTTRPELEAVKADIPDITGLATKAEVEQIENKIPDISNLATKSEIPNVSNFASKAELASVESKIPSTSNFATKSELSEVEGKIPNTDNFATKSELSSVEESIPDTTGLATKSEVQAIDNKIPDVSNLATKTELTAVENKIPNVDNFVVRTELTTAISNVENKIPSVANLATKEELNSSITNVKSSIPDTTGLATKVELSNVAANIPETYLEVANLGDGSLTIIDNKGKSVVFTPSTTGGGAVDSVNGQTGTVVIDIPTKVSELENDSGYLTSHQDISNLATKAELSNVEAKIPSISNLATQDALSEVEGKIPTEYIKSVSSIDNALTFTTSSNNAVEYKPIFYVNAQMDGLSEGSLVKNGGTITADKTYTEIKNALTVGQSVQLKIVNTKDNTFWVMTSEFLSSGGFILFSGHGRDTGETSVSMWNYWTFRAAVYENDTWSFRGDNIYRTAITHSEQWIREQAFATQASLSNVEAKIPENYLKSATVDNNKLTITKSDNTSIEFGGGGASESQVFWVSFDAEDVCDKTYAEIKAAYEAGKTLVAKILWEDVGTQIGWLSAYYPEDLIDEGVTLVHNGFWFTWSEPYETYEEGQYYFYQMSKIVQSDNNVLAYDLSGDMMNFATKDEVSQAIQTAISNITNANNVSY